MKGWPSSVDLARGTCSARPRPSWRRSRPACRIPWRARRGCRARARRRRPALPPSSGKRASRTRCAWRHPCPASSAPSYSTSTPMRPPCTYCASLPFRLHLGEAAHGDVLADLLHQRLALRLDARVGRQRREIRRVLGGHQFRQHLRIGEEVVVLGDEVGLAVEFHQRTELAIRRQVGADDALGGDASGGLARLGAALDAQQLFGLFQVAARFGSAPSCIPSFQARSFRAVP